MRTIGDRRAMPFRADGHSHTSPYIQAAAKLLQIEKKEEMEFFCPPCIQSVQKIERGRKFGFEI